ncbi:MAG: lipopolysaccharide heptosyltransferase I, partial [Thermoanaerobaculia bacterium]
DSLLIIRLSALGDVLHTIPAVFELRCAFPSAEISWVVEPAYAELVAEITGVDRVISVASKRWRRNLLAGQTYREAASVRRSLRAAAAGDSAVDFQGLLKSASLGWIAGARRRFGFDAGSIRERAALMFINRPIDPGDARHIIEINRGLARRIILTEGGTPCMPVEPDFSDWASSGSTQATQRAVRERFAVLLPGSGGEGKNWNIDRWKGLADIVAREHALRPLVVWGPGEEGLAATIAAGGPAVKAPETDLRELAFVLSRAKIVIGGDTGPLHLAAALRTAVVGLFGPTDPARNGPWRQQDRCVETYTKEKTMEAITLERVAGRIREVLV